MWDEPASVDLHGLHPEQALRRLGQALHTARVRGDDELLVITGRGTGNETGRPVLRRRVEEWLRGPEGRGRGVGRVEVTAKGGALRVHLS
jgi:DNA-nicking Smr family endonuclease